MENNLDFEILEFNDNFISEDTLTHKIDTLNEITEDDSDEEETDLINSDLVDEDNVDELDLSEEEKN